MASRAGTPANRPSSQGASRLHLRNVAGSNFSTLLEAEVSVTGPEHKILRPVKTLEEVQLQPQLYENVKKSGYTKLTPVQQYTIPYLMKSSNVMCCSQTGSGKTAAYLIPVIDDVLRGEFTDRFSGGIPAFPQALILSPTRELVVQICDEAKRYAKSTSLEDTIHAVYGGTNMTAERNRIAAHGCNIIVATVGRLADIVSQGILDLSQVRLFILDEADEMMARGFIFEIRELLKRCPTDDVRTTAMFSATFPNAVLKASQKLLGQNHIFVKVGVAGSASSDVTQNFELVERPEKMYNLFQILGSRNRTDKILVFCETIEAADRVFNGVESKGFQCALIHSELEEQREREEALRRFASGNVQILIATSIAARGLDIPNVNLVVNYDLPEGIEEYILRIGRTGRAGNAGEACSFFEPVHNAPLAAALLQTLKDSNQHCPEWMEEIRRDEEKTEREDAELYGWGSDWKRQRNALGTTPRGIPLPCEDLDESWD